MTMSKDAHMRLLTKLLTECRRLGIKTADVASSAKWALDNNALTVAKLSVHIETLRSRLHDHNTTTTTTSKRKAS